MESPVVVDKPPEYHGSTNANERGFPFDDEEGSSAWSELASRHPDVAARLRTRPSPAAGASAPAWARKRRPASQDGVDDFGSTFEDFDRFPFDDIPPEFREHLPSHWNRRFEARNDRPRQNQGRPPQAEPEAASTPRAHQSAATQTDETPQAQHPSESLPQYGLRNTVDLGQKSPADPSLVDADDRNQRSVSAPPTDHLPEHNYASRMSGPNQHQPQAEQNAEHPPPSNVRHIPIFVEGRDEPVINKNVEHGPTYAAPSPPDRDQYFADEAPPSFQHPHNFSRTFPTPFNRQAGFRQGPQPFVQQKVYPQNAFARANSPQRSQSPKPQMHPEEHYIKVPVHHEQSVPKKSEHVPSNKTHQQQKSPQQPHPQPPQQQQQQQQQQQMPRARTPPQPQQPPPPPQQPSPANDPISVILNVQTDVLNLMTEVENFKGTKKDKKYLYLDEMLTRNLIKLDNIETDGKENVRLARKEAIKCIQKCIAVLEAKAESNTVAAQSCPSPSQPQQDVEMKDNAANEAAGNNPSEPKENGEVVVKEVEMKNEAKESKSIENPKDEQLLVTPQQNQEAKKGESEQNEQQHQQPNGEQPQAQPDTRQTVEANETTSPKGEQTTPAENTDNTTKPVDNQATDTTKEENKTKSPKPAKKGSKGGKKRDKSKDNKEEETNEKTEDGKVDSAKAEDENVGKQEKAEPMQVDEKGDSKSTNSSQTMEVEAAPTPSQ